MKDTSDEPGNNAWQTHTKLAADLDRVRGVAVQQAKAANARLRKQAYLASVTGIGIGILLGYFGSRRCAARG